ncbi:3-oxoacyl-ACP synthase III family protein [Streptomyces sp. NPDC040750]|uniref:3-oxoacyl-ACP synthase III family protein n=1 Tax=Streptomyces sp. NPDC040750 TaxID=3154491 RepID=UPI003408002A
MTATAFIAGTGTALPGEPVDNATLGRALGLSAEWIDLFVGTRSRHFARDLDSGETLGTLASLCARAAAEALERAGLDPADVDFLLLATATPDQLLPTTATQVADLLGLGHLPAYQVQAGCSGALQAVELGRALIAAGASAGLVIGGDVTHRHLDLRPGAARRPAGELVNYVLFGDGAGAAVLTARPCGDRLAVRGVLHRFTGLGRPPGQVVHWYGPGDGAPEGPAVSEDYKAIEEYVPDMAAEAMWETLDVAGWQPADLDYVLPPQLSRHMTRRILDRLELPGVREISCVTDTGNTGNALPFHQLDRLAATARPGERAIVLAVESSKWIRTGAGLEKL